MRNEERWDEILLPRYLKMFTPRIQDDIQGLPFPKDISKTKKIKSSFIYGDTETGKTIYGTFLSLQYCKLRYLSNDLTRFRFFYIPVPDLFDELKKEFEINRSEMLSRCKDVDLLYLDELGLKKANDWAVEIIYMIINYRYEYKKTTIITSNLSLEELSAQFGDDRITNRIQRQYEIIKKKPWKK